MVGNLDLALMQSEPDAQRMRALGLPPERVRVTGNMKFDTSVDRAEHHLTAEFRHRFGLSDGRQLIVAASTHEPEEQITIDAYQELRKRYSDRSPRLLIAPRHPERFAQTASLLNESGLSWTRRSREPKESDTKCDAILLDSIGELRAVYPLADIVFVGGSIAPNGGHNILEPVVAGACVVTGAHTHNFTEIINAFVDADALIQLLPVPEPDAPKALAFAFAELLESDEKRDGLVSRARGLVESNRGATDQTIELIGTLMNHGEQLKEVETEARGSSDN
jgi:3-deoxy-D-manno-octulosonic-acid transferase